MLAAAVAEAGFGIDAEMRSLERIADPLGAMILVDDLATSGWHVEESLTALRRLGTAAPAFTWITGTVT